MARIVRVSVVMRVGPRGRAGRLLGLGRLVGRFAPRRQPRCSSSGGSAGRAVTAHARLSGLGAPRSSAPGRGRAAGPHPRRSQPVPWWSARPRLPRRRRCRALRAGPQACESLDELPDVVDLLVLARRRRPHPVPLGWPLVARRAVGPVADALAERSAAPRRGRPPPTPSSQPFSRWATRAASLGHLLADRLRYGTPLEPGLSGWGSAEARIGGAAAEEPARRVPVRLLLPLVACTLPAFALLTVVPLLVVRSKPLDL